MTSTSTPFVAATGSGSWTVVPLNMPVTSVISAPLDLSKPLYRTEKTRENNPISTRFSATSPPLILKRFWLSIFFRCRADSEAGLEDCNGFVLPTLRLPYELSLLSGLATSSYTPLPSGINSSEVGRSGRATRNPAKAVGLLFV